MRLPNLQSAPVQRLALPEPQVEAAGYGAARQVAGEIAQLAGVRAQQAVAAEYTDKFAKVNNYDITIRDEIRKKPYMRVDDLPQDVDVPTGTIEQRYDEQSGTMRDFVPTYEIADKLYQSLMTTRVGEEVATSRNALVGERLKNDTQLKIVARSREELLRYSFEQGMAHDTAKFQVSMDEFVKVGDEASALELIARGAETFGLNEDLLIDQLGSDIDQSYFTRGARDIKTRDDAESLRSILSEGEWRFDDKTYNTLFNAINRKAQAFYEAEKADFEDKSSRIAKDLSLSASRGDLTPESVSILKSVLSPTDYKYLLGRAMTGETGFKTPSKVMTRWQIEIEAVENGAYRDDTMEFADVVADLKQRLVDESLLFDPLTGRAVGERISAGDFAQLMGKIQALTDQPFKQQEYRETIARIKTLVGDASSPAFSVLPAQERAIIKVSLDAAQTALNAYMREMGTRADPVQWAEDNLPKYVKNVSRAALMNIPEADRDIFIIGEDGKVNYSQSLGELKASLKRYRKANNQDRIDRLLAQINVLDNYKRNYPDNVR